MKPSERNPHRPPSSSRTILPAVLMLAMVVAVGGCSVLAAARRIGGSSSKASDSDKFDARATLAAYQPTDLTRLRSQHPRLLFTNDDFARARALVQSDPVARQWLEKLRDRAVKITREPTPQPGRGAMLAVGREAFTRITTLAGVFRLSGDERFSRRAIDEMLALARFADWSPKDFLATGETTAAMALGYDWLFDVIAPEDRATIRDAILNNGVRSGLAAYRDRQGWTGVRHNWNFVCNGGMVLGALAIADEAPQQSARLLSLSRASMQNAMLGFADRTSATSGGANGGGAGGGWEEGPSYWNYATRYATCAFAALQTALGDDGGLPLRRGFSRTGLYRIAMEGSSGKLFNYGDCDEGTSSAPQMFWIAGEFQQPAYAAFELIDARRDPAMLDLLWYTTVAPVDAGALARESPLAVEFRNVEVAAMRSGWDRDATYVGFKGGRAKAHHGHLDLGSFVLDALGQRWAVDPGADSYDLPGYFDDERWRYYRCRTEGHNTLTIDGANQDLDAMAPIVAFEPDDPNRRFAIVDLASAYPRARRALRGAMLDGRDLILQDELQLSGDSRRIVWNFHTRAQVSIDGATATLQQGGQSLRAQILSPTGAEFEVGDVTLERPQRPDPDLKNLTIRLRSNGARPITITVLFTPDVSGLQQSERAKRIVPLGQWPRSF